MINKEKFWEIVQGRLEEKNLSPSRASELAGLNKGYLKDLKASNFKRPDFIKINAPNF